MPAKDDFQLGPERLGLSERDIMYLLVFRELHKHNASPSEMYDVVREELSTIDRGRARSYLYHVVSQMESFGWIETIRTKNKNNKKYYAITSTGRAKVDSFRESCLDSIKSLKGMADHFSSHITGTGNPEPMELTLAQRKMFSRLINVRYLSRYLILKILTEPDHREETGKNIWYLLKERHQWQPAQGYFYELAHEMEFDQGYIRGAWTTARRSSYIYRLTDLGIEAIDKEAEAALHFLRQLQKYTNFILNLFPEHNQPNNHASV
ncbi:helix-turn-helix transcriptional regulator [Paenibacillus oralis]|nr:helix-turn-helix transcriptional regulator [Paenibacillus oralis]